jgi:hypothetical protein
MHGKYPAKSNSNESVIFEADEQWFAANPNETGRFRDMLPGEYSAETIEALRRSRLRDMREPPFGLEMRVEPIVQVRRVSSGRHQRELFLLVLFVEVDWSEHLN